MLVKTQKKEVKAKINLVYLNHQSYQTLTLSERDMVSVASNKNVTRDHANNYLNFCIMH